MKNLIQVLYQNILHVIGKIFFTYDKHIIFYYKLKYLKMYFVDSDLAKSEQVIFTHSIHKLSLFK